jgi:hypothetical protein
MKISQIFLILFVSYLAQSKVAKSHNTEFDEIVSFLQKNPETSAATSDDLYNDRLNKIRRKKEIIIKKVYEISPIVGELLALANVEKIDLIVNPMFIVRERDLLKKHIIMWDADSNYLDHSSKVLLNLLICNNNFNRLRCILNLLMEGLCKGDTRSIKIFKEIVVTVIIDHIMKLNFYNFNDLKAKFNLIKIFNKPQHFKPVQKIQFIEGLNINDKLKEILTFIVMELKSQNEILILSDNKLHEIPALLSNNTNLFQFIPGTDNLMGKTSPEAYQRTLEDEVVKSINKQTQGEEVIENDLPNLNSDKSKMSKEESKKALENIKSYASSTDMRFKEKILLENEHKEQTYKYSEFQMVDPSNLDMPQNKKIKLSQIKEELKNEFTDYLLNQTTSSMPIIEEVIPSYQVGLNSRSIFTKYRNHVETLIKLNWLLDQFPPETPNGIVDVTSPQSKTINVRTTVSKEVEPGVSVTMHFKEKENEENFRFKSKIGSSSKLLSTIKNEDFAEQSIQQLMTRQSFNKVDEPQISNKEQTQPSNNLNDPSITQKIIDQSNSQEIKKMMSDKNVKVLYPKEIETKYQITRKGTKTIETNKNSIYFFILDPTKKLILNKVLSHREYNDLMVQQEKSMVNDPLGLYTVLKNIQSRKCSCGFLCIEIGSIYGDFNTLKPKNITIPVDEQKDVHMIIKPIVIVNSTAPEIPKKMETATKANVDLFDNDDCDELKISTPNNPPRFKETSGQIEVKHQNVQRKFYRKVSVGEDVYSQDTFKQGLNLIIVEREKHYSKIFEQTFDTNDNIHDAEKMAEILKDTPCSKIIIITGIGKWMGAMTPALIKEIKQVGGPDLNNLYSADQDDNTSADHAFILIGRRGLCRYNGIFRVKNYDLSSKLAQAFPDASSDPNDCFFEDVSLENSKNSNSEKEFYHNIDLRLTLNINNDNRFAYDAPTISTVSPFKGSIHGGQEIKIGGFNFGKSTTDIKEILVRGVICGDFLLLGPNLISCVTRASTIMGPGAGNVIIKMRNGYESPKRTCSVFEYTGDKAEALNDLKQTIVTVKKMKDLPIYMNANYHDQDVSIFDHLMFNQAHYKKKLRPDRSNLFAGKLDTMVQHNYKNLIEIVNEPQTNPLGGAGFKGKRFRGLLGNLKVCDEDKK